VVCYLRDKTIEVSEVYDTKQLQAWHDAYCDKITKWDEKTYNPGGHCIYCPRQACCPGLNAELAQVTTAVDLVEEWIEPMPDQLKVRLWERTGTAQAFLEKARTVLKAQVEAAGGTIQGDGKALMLKDRTKQTINARPAWPVLAKALTEDELADCVTIGKTAVLDAVGAKASRGQKKYAKEAIVKALEDAGAIETTTYKVITVVQALPEAQTKELTEKENADGE
jgi:hypothetical protein